MLHVCECGKLKTERESEKILNLPFSPFLSFYKQHINHIEGINNNKNALRKEQRNKIHEIFSISFELFVWKCNCVLQILNISMGHKFIAVIENLYSIGTFCYVLVLILWQFSFHPSTLWFLLNLIFPSLSLSREKMRWRRSG